VQNMERVSETVRCYSGSCWNMFQKQDSAPAGPSGKQDSTFAGLAGTCSRSSTVPLRGSAGTCSRSSTVPLQVLVEHVSQTGQYICWSCWNMFQRQYSAFAGPAGTCSRGSTVPLRVLLEHVPEAVQFPCGPCWNMFQKQCSAVPLGTLPEHVPEVV
jgi:hypothetical protein